MPSIINMIDMTLMGVVQNQFTIMSDAINPKSSRKISTFIKPFGLFSYTVGFGLHNAPAMFQ